MAEQLPKYLDQEQVRGILGAAYKTSARDGLALEVAYFFGLRVSELVGLQRTDYKRSAGRLRVRRSKGSLDGEYPLPPPLKSKIESYLAGRSDHVPTLFAGRQGALSTRQVQLLFDQYAEAAGVELHDGQGVHALRHSIAVHLLEAEWDLTEVQKHLGHRRISSTQVYAQISDRRREQRINALAGDKRIVSMD